MSAALAAGIAAGTGSLAKVEAPQPSAAARPSLATGLAAQLAAGASSLKKASDRQLADKDDDNAAGADLMSQLSARMAALRSHVADDDDEDDDDGDWD